MYIRKLTQRFTPKGKKMVISFLKENKTTLKEDFGFVKLQRIISDRGLTQKFESELLDQHSSLREITNDILNKVRFVEIIKMKIAQNNKKNIFKELDKLYKKTKSEIKHNPRGKMAFTVSKHFAQKKQQLLNLLQTKIGYPAKFFYLSTTPETIDMRIEVFDTLILLINRIAHPIKFLQRVFNNKKELDAYRKFITELSIDMQKILLSPSRDKRVRKIEKILQKKYGFEYVRLDNLNDATKILKAVQIAQKHNIPLNKNIIVTPFLKSSSAGQNHLGGDTIMINTDCGENYIKKFTTTLKKISTNPDYNCSIEARLQQEQLELNSTSNSLHLYLHELVHNENRYGKILPVIPNSFKPTVKALGSYAEVNFNVRNEEVRAELRVKQILEKLTYNEEELLKLLQKSIEE